MAWSCFFLWLMKILHCSSIHSFSLECFKWSGVHFTNADSKKHWQNWFPQAFLSLQAVLTIYQMWNIFLVPLILCFRCCTLLLSHDFHYYRYSTYVSPSAWKGAIRKNFCAIRNICHKFLLFVLTSSFFPLLNFALLLWNDLSNATWR